ncbi:Autoimmune regulator [Trema orientale]|uniref:Autoimmune regulator n=1 Tax=Trema orientale TaxID=63057 RepID=A0A2P5E9I9_TREOI|nr:Autoimmune regulator [Trema orientale]
MARAQYAVAEEADYSELSCEQCGSGENPDELLLCDKCDKGFHMKCLRPIVARVPIGSWLCPKCSGQRRVRSFSQKKIIDFFRIQKCKNGEEKFTSPQVSHIALECELSLEMIA